MPDPPVDSFNDVRRTLASEAMFILIITGLTYLLVYTFEVGYCSHFHIPIALIRPEIATVLLFAATIATFGFSVLNLTYVYIAFQQFIERRANPLVQRMVLGNGPVLIAALAVGLFTGFWWMMLGMLIVAVPFSLLIFVGKGTAAEKLSAWDSETERTNAFPFTVFRRLRQRGMGWTVHASVWTLLLFSTCFVLGRSFAERAHNFLVTDISGPAVVLRIYGDELICANFDPGKKSCSHTFTILKTGDPDRQFQLSAVGPLQPPPKL